MEIIKIDDLQKLENYKGAWNEVLDKIDSDNIFLTYDFIATFLKYFDYKEIIILIIKDKSEIIGIAPLIKTDSETIEFIRNGHSYEPDFIIKRNKEEVIEAVIKYFIESENWKKIVLNDVNEVSSMLIKKAIKKTNLLITVQEGRISPIIKVDKSWNDYLNSRSKKNRHHIKQYLKNIENKDFSITNFRKSEEIGDGMDALVEVSKKSWQERNKSAISSSATLKGFYQELAKSSSKLDQVMISILFFKDSPISFMYYLMFKNKFYTLKWGYDEKYMTCSPGGILISNVFKDIFEKSKAETIDLLGEFDTFKKNWTDEGIRHKNITIYKQNLTNSLKVFAINHWNKIKDNRENNILFNFSWKIVNKLKKK